MERGLGKRPELSEPLVTRLAECAASHLTLPGCGRHLNHQDTPVHPPHQPPHVTDSPCLSGVTSSRERSLTSASPQTNLDFSLCYPSCQFARLEVRGCTVFALPPRPAHTCHIICVQQKTNEETQ